VLSVEDTECADDEFEYFQDLVRRLCGIHLKPIKRDLLKARLLRRLDSLGLSSIAEYRSYLSSLPSSNDEWQVLINVMTTNKTDFFREPSHFEYLTQRYLPEWEKHQPQRKLRVWSAASSTGEEAYSLALVLDDYFKGADRFEVYASDVDTDVIAHARNGVYSIDRLQGIPPQYHLRGVARGSGLLRRWFKIKKDIQAKVRFQYRNLVETPYSDMGTFDIIFCRNVFIYFAADLIEKIINEFYEISGPGSLLVIGHAETLQNTKSQWEHGGASIFTRAAKKSLFFTSKAPVPVKVRTATRTLAPITRQTSDVHAPPSPATYVSKKKKVLIVDDSKTIRDMLERLFRLDNELIVIGKATNPVEAWDVINRERPDVITLDIHMPEMDGISFLEKLLPQYKIPVVMITSISQEESDHVFRALELGAVDYIQKPSFSELSSLGPVICEKVRQAATSKVLHNQKKLSPVTRSISGQGLDQSTIVAIGSSTGGTEALKHVLTQLPKGIPSIVIVQHIPPVFSAAFANRLNQLCPFEVKEAQSGDLLIPDQVLIAPGAKQLSVVPNGNGYCVKITDAPPVNRHKPSVDVLFDSVAKHIGKRAIGIILTGMGADGAKGLLKMREAGARTAAQDEKSCVVFGMPKEAIKLGAAQEIRPLEEMATLLCAWLDKGNKTSRIKKCAA